MTASALFFAGMGVGVKVAGRSLPNAEVVFFRNALGLLMLLPLVARRGFGDLPTRHFKEHLLRGLAGLAAMYCFFYALAHMRLAEAVLLNYSLPLFMPMIERFWLKEPIPPGLWRSLVLGFAGVMLILKPGAGVFQPVALVGVCAALLGALAQVGVRRLTRSEPTTRIVFYFGIIATAVSAGAVPSVWVAPQPALWLVLLALGTAATLGQLFLTRAYAQAPAARVGPFIYAAVVFAALFDWVLWDQLPDPTSMAGAVLVVAAGALTLRLAGRGSAEDL
jgi:drug/metabolite transporter (DMT)-like permease